MKLRNPAIFLLFVLTTFSCATTQNYEKILNTWVGSHADNLVAAWGPPHASHRLSNGGWVLEYHSQSDMQMGGYTYTEPQTTYHNGSVNTYGTYGSTYGTYSGTSTTYVQKQSPVYNIPLSCRTIFTTSANGYITKWSWQGNNCVAYPPKEITTTSSATYQKSNLKRDLESIENATIKHIDTNPIDNSSVFVTNENVIYVKYDFLNLHSKPGFDSKVIGTINMDTPLKTKQENDNWYLVETPSGKGGWIAKKWVK